MAGRKTAVAVGGAGAAYAYFAAQTELGHYDKADLSSKQDQLFAKHMRRLPSSARPDWKERCETAGFSFHSADGVLYGREPLSAWVELLSEWSHQLGFSLFDQARCVCMYA